MIQLPTLKRSSTWLMACLCGLCLGGRGCSQRNSFSVDPARVPNTWLGPLTVAVAPALNFSGSTDFDPDKVADLMASELGHADGISVIPVSRVLAVMSRLGITEVGSPAQALSIKDRLGADAILVFAVTEYDPYDPPVVGIAAQLYGRAAGRTAGDGLNPVLVSRQARPFAVGQVDQGVDLPIAQTQQVYNAAHDFILHRVRQFADHRGDDGSAFGWRLFLVSQEHYFRFCTAQVVKQLFDTPQGKRPMGAVPGEVAP